MGSPLSEEGRGDDEEQHTVDLEAGFWMLETPVTVGMYRVFVEANDYLMGAGEKGKGGWGYDAKNNRLKQSLDFTWDNPGFKNGFLQTDRHPVTQVDWAGAVAFCNWLAKESGRLIRLPSEVEWEHACRAETAELNFRFSCGNKLKNEAGEMTANCDNVVGHTTEVRMYREKFENKLNEWKGVGGKAIENWGCIHMMVGSEWGE